MCDCATNRTAEANCQYTDMRWVLEENTKGLDIKGEFRMAKGMKTPAVSVLCSYPTDSGALVLECNARTGGQHTIIT